MIPVTLRITLSIAVICYFILILYYLKKKRIELKYTLLWLFSGLIMGLMIFFPHLLIRFVKLLGIESNMNGLYILCFGFIIAILMSLTSIVSGQSNRIRILLQEIAMQDKRIRELEQQAVSQKREELTKGGDVFNESINNSSHI